MQFAEVILPLSVQGTFTYLIPEHLEDEVSVGSRVLVQFGKSRFYTAIVDHLHREVPDTEVKEIEDLIQPNPFITAAQLELWHWMASYYMCSLGEVYQAAVPSIFRMSSETILKAQEVNEMPELKESEHMLFERIRNSKRVKLKELRGEVSASTLNELLSVLMGHGLVEDAELIQEKRSVRTRSFLRHGPELTEDFDWTKLKRSPRKKLALELFLKEEGEVEKVPFQKKHQLSSTLIKKLIDSELLLVEERTVQLFNYGEEAADLVELSEAQSVAYEAIRASEQAIHLLHGVTSSGKTELYFHLIRDQLNAKKQALYLLPEIALSSQMIRRIEKHFGDQLVVFHSQMNPKERAEAWNKSMSGESGVILGARSALFLPFHDLGLIIVDEEHDASYKQQDPAPRYNARDSALVLARKLGAEVILGSATPSLESMHMALVGQYNYVELEGRFQGVLPPQIEIANLSEEQRKKSMKELLSSRLHQELKSNLNNSYQSILFQNRRGYSPFLQCGNCGHVHECPNCDITLTYHRHNHRLRCHYCGYQRDVPKSCERCEHPAMMTKGFGTEQIQEMTEMLFPKAKVLRMDYDTTRSKSRYEAIIEQFSEGDADILVGTQMVSKGLDFERVRSVGVLQVDQMLHFPDFRAHERALQILLQVAGRSGRRNERGVVILQSYEPEHSVLYFVKMGGFKEFVNNELSLRKEFHYPPFYRLIRVVLKSRKLELAQEAAKKLAKGLVFEGGVETLGPEAPPVGRLRNFYLQHILLKFPRTVSPSQLKKNILARVEHYRLNKDLSSVIVHFDVDPIS
jgi:primosomal protein N' (replication factor Y)